MNNLVYKPVFSVSSNVTSPIYMDINMHIAPRILTVFSSSLGYCKQLTLA